MRLELYDQTHLVDIECHFWQVHAVQAEGIKGDHLYILVNKLLRDKKSMDCELNQCNYFVQVDILKKPSSILMEFFQMY